jgi:predicted lipoprotein with Yx(FWY)xxD motif
VNRLRTLTALLALAVAGCGGDDGGGAAAPAPRETATKKHGVAIVLRDSDFGPMLFDSSKQAIYVFERDRRNESVCYGDCAKAWPPVLSAGAPAAGDGVRPSLLGTIKRRGGRRQVTYAGRPLYFYAHEDAGQVLCHNVNLNGGFWWAVGADGKARPA